jgi:FKBP-type peptidyl-prolyl cis-trans isomerase FkpA
MRRHLASALLLAATSTACGSNPAAPSLNVAFSQVDLVVGTGAEATNGALLTVDYAGWLYEEGQPDSKGRLFDTSVGRQPFVFRLGARQVIQGWDLGVPGMRVGGLRRLIIPPNLGYGSSGSGSIPPNATLIFEVELLAVQP